jgi:hypothetical protein
MLDDACSDYLADLGEINPAASVEALAKAASFYAASDYAERYPEGEPAVVVDACRFAKGRALGLMHLERLARAIAYTGGTLDPVIAEEHQRWVRVVIADFKLQSAET